MKVKTAGDTAQTKNIGGKSIRTGGTVSRRGPSGPTRVLNAAGGGKTSR